LYKDEEKYKIFTGRFQKVVSQTLHLKDLNSVYILGIERGSIRVIYEIIDNNGIVVRSDNSLQQLEKTLAEEFPGLNIRIQLNRFFRFCNLSQELFDAKGNFDFRNYGVEANRRGGFPYYQPLTWKRYGIKVIGRYENDNWLAMNGNNEEWAVGFHGLRNKDCINNIINNGLLTTGAGQAYSTSLDTRTNQICGRGAYLSNHIEVCEIGYCVFIPFNNNRYKIAFQCRLRPNSIRIPMKSSDIPGKGGNPVWDNDYWIVNNSNDIRPYGILLKKF